MSSLNIRPLNFNNNIAFRQLSQEDSDKIKARAANDLKGMEFLGEEGFLAAWKNRNPTKEVIKALGLTYAYKDWQFPTEKEMLKEGTETYSRIIKDLQQYQTDSFISAKYAEIEEEVDEEIKEENKPGSFIDLLRNDIIAERVKGWFATYLGNTEDYFTPIPPLEEFIPTEPIRQNCQINHKKKKNSDDKPNL